MEIRVDGGSRKGRVGFYTEGTYGRVISNFNVTTEMAFDLSTINRLAA